RGRRLIAVRVRVHARPVVRIAVAQSVGRLSRLAVVVPVIAGVTRPQGTRVVVGQRAVHRTAGVGHRGTRIHTAHPTDTAVDLRPGGVIQPVAEPRLALNTGRRIDGTAVQTRGCRVRR